mmetsp:Transcript_14870/g.41080  ORF Transcript_14870/g.41080 Transcript_14870/m.41080 type:complete len:657 (+) Transcript_14870:218-2188(+)
MKRNDTIKHCDVEFCLDKACSVTLSELFRKQSDGTVHFKVEDGVLDLSCLDDIRVSSTEGKERFLPNRIFVRSYLHGALKHRLARDNDVTILFGSPGIGKSVFAFLAAIAAASSGNHNAVLYVRKVEDENEVTTSLFWMTTVDGLTVDIVACRTIDDQYSVRSVCRAISYAFFDGDINKASSPTGHGIKIIVDGPKYDEKAKQKPKGADLITSGGCPAQKQENMEEFHFPINVWSFDDIFKALKSLKQCSRATVERIFDVTGGSIRLAVMCSSNAGVDEKALKKTQNWTRTVVKAQANDAVVDMAYQSTELSTNKNSLDRLRSMIVGEIVDEDTTNFEDYTPFFDTTLVLASAFVARLLWTKIDLSQVTKAMNYARSTGNNSLFGWHFELWGHKVSEAAIDEWRKEVTKARLLHPPSGTAVHGVNSPPDPDYIQATGTGLEGVGKLKAVWLYWKPSIPNFANIDAAILLGDGMLVCIQFTIGEEHGFDMLSFLHGFVYNIPQDVRAKVKTIKVIFVVPSDVTFTTVRIPVEQKGLVQSHVNNSEPKIKYVKPKATKSPAVPKHVSIQGTAGVDQEKMDTDSDSPDDADFLDDCISFDESFDDAGWFSADTTVDNMDSANDTLISTVEVAFETKAVALHACPDNLPFFDLPSPELFV